MPLRFLLSRRIQHNVKYKIVLSDVDRLFCRNLIFDNPDLVLPNRERQRRWRPPSRLTVYGELRT